MCNMKLLDVIKEIADDINNIFPYKMTVYQQPYQDDYEIYQFSTPTKEYTVKFFPWTQERFEGIFEREYKTNDMYGSIKPNSLTNEHMAIKVNATIMALTIDWLERNPIKEGFRMLVIQPIDKRRYKIVKRFIDRTIKGKYKISGDSKMIFISNK